MSADQLAELAGTEVGEAEPALMGGLPVCKWPISESRYIRVGSLPAPDWAQGVPQVLQVMEDKGLVKDKELLDEVRALFDASDVLTPTEACQAFSAILELQGQPAGTQIAINLAPSKEAPHGVSGQMCSVGRFTTVQIADTREVLAKPYPVERVATALKLAHRSSMQ